MRDQKAHSVYLGLGSNLGNRKRNIHLALEKLEDAGVRVIEESDFYTSPAWGYTSSNAFFNLCIIADTPHSPEQMIKVIKGIEVQMGREKKATHYTDRIIDIDILFFDQLILNSETLTIPHPHIQDRRFVLAPLAEIAPELTHPVLLKTINELLYDCKDEGRVDRVVD